MGNARYYKKNGHQYPRVTSITGQLDKPALTYWAANCACDYILQEMSAETTMEGLSSIIESARKNFRSVSYQALDIGSAVHEAVERYLKTGVEPQAPSEEVLSGFLAFLEWQDKHELLPIATEQTLYSDTYAGTCDLVCVLDGKKYLIDFKTTKKPKQKGGYDEWKWQLAAYRNCIPGLQGAGILRLDKDTGKPDFYDYSDTYEEDLRTFLLLTDLWYMRHPRFKRSIK